MKAFLQILILVLISNPQTIFGQENKPSSKINNGINEKDTTKNSSDVFNVNNLDHALFILDSILNENGIDFNYIQQALGDINIDDNHLNKMIESISKDFNLFELSPTTKKVVLGVVIDDYSSINDANQKNPTITEVIQNSAAEKAGLLKKDILYTINKKEVHTIQDIFDIMIDKKEGDSLNIQYIRNRDTLLTIATLQACKSHNNNWFTLFQDKMGIQDSCDHNKGKPFCEKIIIQKSGPRLGVKVTDLNAEARKSLKAKKGGAMITKVQPRSAAAIMQLQVNDVITEINGQEILNISELKSIVNNLPMPQEIEVKYIRYGKKKKAKGMINEFSKPWDDNEMMNVIDMSKFPIE